MPTIILFVVLILPGQPQPAKHMEQMPSLEDCLSAVQDILKKGVEGNHSIQAGCVIQPAKQEGT